MPESDSDEEMFATPDVSQRPDTEMDKVAKTEVILEFPRELAAQDQPLDVRISFYVQMFCKPAKVDSEVMAILKAIALIGHRVEGEVQAMVEAASRFDG